MKHFLKNISLVLLLFIIKLSPAKSQEYFSYYKGKKRFYSISANQFIVGYKSKIAASEVNSKSKKIEKSIDLIDNTIFLTSLADNSSNNNNIKELIDQFKNDSTIRFASPVLINDAGKQIGGVTDQVVVKLRDEVLESRLFELVKKTKVKSIRKYEYDSKTYYLTVDNTSKYDALTLANFLYESELFEFAEPDLMLFIKSSTNDQYFNQQWALTNTNVLQAWNTSNGGASCVRIAILDNGVELDHPDLINNLDSGFDATDGSSNGAPSINDDHGTQVAGVAAAEGNNTVGVAGVAYNARIIPVRVYHSGSNSGPTELATSNWIAAGIDWAWQSNRADILNMSFIQQVGMSVIDDAINRAVTLGRNGNGCVLVAASGNGYSSTVAYPASNLQVIAVGATHIANGRADFSNYGSNIELVAPGVDIYTTDLEGPFGDNSNYGVAGNYVSGADGTSFAAPIVSGLVALMFSVDPNMLGIRARQILQQTAEKLSGYSFTPVGGGSTWNNEVGFGLVDAKRAMEEVFSFSGPSHLCTTNENYTITNIPSGTTAIWSVSPAMLFAVDSGTGSTFNTRANSSSSFGEGTISATFTSCGKTITTTKTIWIGAPKADNIDVSVFQGGGGEHELCYEMESELIAATYIEQADIDPPVVGFDWIISDPSVVLGYHDNVVTPGYIDHGVEIDMYSVYDDIDVSVRAYNSCSGSYSGYHYQTFTPINCGGGWFFMAISPNPTSNELTISFTKGKDSAPKKSELSKPLSSQENVLVRVEVYNSEQTSLLSTTGYIFNSNIKLNTSSLKSGSYIIHVLVNDKV